MATEYIHTQAQVTISTKAIGKIHKSTVLAKNSSRMVQSTKDHFSTAKSMEKESTSGDTTLSTKETFITITCTAKVFTQTAKATRL